MCETCSTHGKKSAHNILIGRLQEKNNLGDPTVGGRNNIKMHLRETGF